MKRKFIIPSLVAAGLMGVTPAYARPPDQADAIGETDEASLLSAFRQHDAVHVAQHRSHQSHASHGSHRSSSGGSAPRAPSPPLYIPPSPRNYGSTPPSSVLPSPPSVPRPAAPPGGMTGTVISVQLALRALGYYNGAIDGIIGSASRSALSRFQADYGLTVTGTITPEVLRALRINS